MRRIVIVLSILILSVTCYGAQGKIKIPPLGFHTVDFSSEFWRALKDDYKLTGKVSRVLRYENIGKIFVIRCNMHIPGGDFLEKTMRASIGPEQQFSVGPVPERISRELRTPLLSAGFEIENGDLGLLTLYTGMTIMELNGRYGMILEKKNGK